MALVVAHAAASALHFADNAVRFGHYHDQATAWLNPTTVVVAWVAQTSLGLAGLLLQRRGSWAGVPMLLAYGALGFAGLLHYVAPPSQAMGFAMHALITLEGATGLALLLGMLVARMRPTLYATSK